MRLRDTRSAVSTLSTLGDQQSNFCSNAYKAGGQPLAPVACVSAKQPQNQLLAVFFNFCKAANGPAILLCSDLDFHADLGLADHPAF